MNGDALGLNGQNRARPGGLVDTSAVTVVGAEHVAQHVPASEVPAELPPARQPGRPRGAAVGQAALADASVTSSARPGLRDIADCGISVRDSCLRRAARARQGQDNATDAGSKGSHKVPAFPAYLVLLVTYITIPIRALP